MNLHRTLRLLAAGAAALLQLACAARVRSPDTSTPGRRRHDGGTSAPGFPPRLERLLPLDVRTKAKQDRMHSFLLAETLKYAYLLFAPAKTLDLRRVVFNTEAHPITRTW